MKRGITESHGYNASLEYTSTQATSSTGTALNLSLSYNLTGGDNGTVTGITNNVDPGRNQTLTYDPLNRILSAQSSATSGADCWGQVFGPNGTAADDAFGNFTNINAGPDESSARSHLPRVVLRARRAAPRRTANQRTAPDDGLPRAPPAANLRMTSPLPLAPH